MSALRYKLWTALGIALICVPGGAWAQQQSQDQGQSQDQSQPQDQSQVPIPAYHSSLASAGDNANPAPQTLSPDTQPLAGVQLLSLGIPESRTYWQPSANVSTTVTSNGLGAATGWTTYGTLLGGLALHYTSGRSDLGMSYLGGGVVSQGSGIGNGVIQELGLIETLSWERTSLSFLEQAAYVPQTGFGYAGVGGLALPGGNPVVIPPGIGVNGTILTTPNQQLENSTFAQVDTKLSPRSSVTVSGGYSLLHFFGTNFQSPSSSVLQAGYNRDLTREDTIAALYRFSALRYNNNSQTINDNVMQLSYARRVTGRLAFQAGAGPEISFFKFPVVTGSGPNSNGSSSLLSWSLNTSLTYQLEASTLALSYGHGVSGGAGVFTGSIGDTVTGSISRPFARTISAAFEAGYARNHALALPGAPTANQTYDYWFGEASVSHPWGRAMNLNLSYEVQYQNSNIPFCAGPTCGTSLVINQITVGLGWRAGPTAF